MLTSGLLCITFGEVMLSILNVIIALLVLMVMVVIHEAGHYLVGKWLGFQINEFSIGFGKAIFQKQLKNGEKFSIRIVPLGGYCAFEGEDEQNDNPKAFNNQKCWKRILVLFAGAFFNFLSAILIISCTFMAYGDTLPVVIDQYTDSDGNIVAFDPGSSDMQIGDYIISVDGTNLSFIQTIPPKEDGQTERVFRIRRFSEDGSHVDIDVNFTVGEGVIPIQYKTLKYGFFEAIGRGFVVNFQLVGKIFSVFIGLFTGATATSDLGGPVTTISTLSQFAGLGLGILMYAVCLISANLAFFNLMPIPALDGSRIVFVIIEWIRGKPVKRNVEAMIHFVGLIVLFAFAIFVDVLKLF